MIGSDQPVDETRDIDLSGWSLADVMPAWM